MASPWKFLTRLVSTRREQKRDNGQIDNVKPEVLAVAGANEAPTGESLADQPAGDERPRRDQSNPVSTKHVPSEEAGSKVDDTVDSESAKIVETGDPALSNDADLAKLEPTAKAASRKQRNRGKKAETIVVVPQVAQVVHTTPDGAMSLDHEIRVLRRQLATKLQLQNAQLKKMLERFES